VKLRWRRWAIALVLPVALIILVAILAVAAGVSIDASRWRDTATQRASAMFGRPVALHGPLRVTLGRGPVLLIGDARVLSPEGFQATELATLGEARVAFDLLDLLRGKVRPRSIEAVDLTVHLERRADGRGNWTAQTSSPPGAAPTDLDLGEVRIQRATVHWHDERTAARRVIDLAALSAGTAADGGLQLSLSGRVDASPQVELKLEGGPVRVLLEGDAPWPFMLDARSSAGRLRADGALDASHKQLRAQFDAALDDPALLARQFGLDPPPLGAAALRGIASLGTTAIQLTELRGTIAGSELAGEFALNWAGPRPRLTGAAHVSQFDFGPWIGPRAASPAARREDGGAGWQTVALRASAPIDTELDLRLDQGLGLPLELRDATLAIRSDAAGLRAPLSATVAGVNVAGEIKLGAAEATPALSVQLATRDQPLGAVVQSLWQVPELEGVLGRLELRLSGRGETLGAWAQELDASMLVTDLSAALRRPQDKEPVAVRLDRLALRATRSEGLRGEGRAVLAGERVALAIRGGRLVDLLGAGALPLEVEARAAPATLRIATELSAAPSVSAGPLRFDFRARRSGELAAWLPVAPDSTLPIALRGRLRLSDEAWRLDQTTLVLGRSDLRLEGSGPRGGGAAVTTLNARGALLDVAQLLSLRSATAPQGRAAAPALPDFAARVDLDLQLQQVLLGQTTLRDVRAQARMRHGHLLPAALSGRLGDTAFEGVAELDLRAEPLGRLELSARAVELGPLLRELQLADGLVAGRAESVQASVQARGSHWSDLVEGAALHARLSGGELIVRATPQGERAELKLRTADIEIPHGGRMAARLEGSIQGTPVQVEARSGTLAQVLRGRDRLPLELSARTPGTQLSLDGTLGLPLGTIADLRLRASGGRLDTLGGLSPVALPAWGPWSIEGPVRATPLRVDLAGVEVRLGNSRLRADAELNLTGQRPQLDLRVVSARVELDDFPRPPRAAQEPRPQRSAIGTARDVTQLTGELLVAQWLRGFDANVDVHASEVVSSDGLVAEAALRARLNQGRLDVGPATLTLPGGSARLSMSSELKANGLDFALAADVDRFDYGFIAAGKGGGAEWHGLVSTRLQLHGSAPSLDAIPLHARGQVDLAVWPNDLRTGQFDLWTVNLLLRVTNLFMPTTPSRLNCIVGRFNFNDGLITEDQLIIDTAAVRIRGAGQVDLESEELDFVFRPRAKGFAVFRLQQPLRVTGTVSDQRIGTDPRDTPEAVLRLIGSPILWPLERLTLGPLPRDGADVCTDPLRAAPG
jgi:uncharacterized protein involved in outer membrane biogenesis